MLDPPTPLREHPTRPGSTSKVVSKKSLQRTPEFGCIPKLAKGFKQQFVERSIKYIPEV